ncbi:putative GTP-binding protein engB [Scheffersomyces xylosifermentans]|uniref:putative GTP-binding protein engB n=1 Tax=Scheffersomyces xylosifermentans TaxID=1304137 RepID=UPI00315DEA4E
MLAKTLGCSSRTLLLIPKRYASIDYLLTALKPTNAKNDSASSSSKNSTSTLQKAEEAPISGVLPPRDLRKLVLTPSDLTNHFRQPEYAPPSIKVIGEAQAFFNRSKVTLEWTLANYEEIPDIKYELLQQKRSQGIREMDPFYKTEYHENLANSKKTFGIPPEQLRPLPEVLLLGHTNVGKSSLLNNLLVNSKALEYAYVSQKAGYTKTLNCFNIGRKLRVIDSPGYGMFGESKQGKVVLEYISKRHLLRRVFILIDSVEGFREEDIQMMDHLVSEGVPFEIVFTKVDVIIAKFMPKKSVFNSTTKKSKAERLEAARLVEEGNAKIIEYFERMVSTAQLDEVVTVPRLIFNMAVTNRYADKIHGFKEVRTIILESCGLLQSSGEKSTFNLEINE